MCNSPAGYWARYPMTPVAITPAGHPGDVTIEDAHLGKITVTATGECTADVSTEDGLTFAVTASNKRVLFDAIDRALSYKSN